MHAKKILDSFKVKIDGAYNKKYTVRYLPLSDKKKVKLYAEYDGKVKKLNSKVFGSYLEFEIPSDNFTIYEVKKNYVLSIVIKSIALILIAALIAFIIKNRKKFKFNFKKIIKKIKLPKFKKINFKEILKG